MATAKQAEQELAYNGPALILTDKGTFTITGVYNDRYFEDFTYLYVITEGKAHIWVENGRKFETDQTMKLIEDFLTNPNRKPTDVLDIRKKQ